MANKSDPSALLLQWRLVRAFEVVVVETSRPNTRVKTKNLGTVSVMRDTNKGKVDNKTDQTLMLLSTTTQAEIAAPYALQVSLLDYSGLNSDLLASYRKGLPPSPTLLQIARKRPVACRSKLDATYTLLLWLRFVGKLKLVHKAWLKSNQPLDDRKDTLSRRLVASEEDDGDVNADSAKDDDDDDDDESSAGDKSDEFEEEHRASADDDVVISDFSIAEPADEMLLPQQAASAKPSTSPSTAPKKIVLNAAKPRTSLDSASAPAVPLAAVKVLAKKETKGKKKARSSNGDDDGVPSKKKLKLAVTGYSIINEHMLACSFASSRSCQQLLD